MPLPSPPWSQRSSPSSPPALSASPRAPAVYGHQLQRLLAKCDTDAHDGCYIVPCSPNELDTLLHDPAFADKARYEYDPQRQRLIIYMAKLLHEKIIRKTVKEIESHLMVALQTLPADAEPLPAIEDCGSPTLELDADSDTAYGVHIPDGCFAPNPNPNEYPSVVIEVSHTERLKNLSRKADNYLLGSDGEITTMIGIDAKGVDAIPSVWVWRLVAGPLDADGTFDYRAEQVDGGPLRDAAGAPVPDRHIILYLSDFLPERIQAGSPRDRSIRVSFAALSEIVTDAVCAEQQRTNVRRRRRQSPHQTKLDPRGRKRKHTSSPIEELQSEDERTVRAADRRSRRRSEQADRDYHPRR